MTVLSFDRVTIRYGDHTALRNVSLTIAPGEIVALIGETGSGKSSAALAALGLLPVQATMTGEIRRNGRAAMIFQEPLAALNPLMRIGEQIAEALRLHRRIDARAARAAAADLMAEVGLDPDRISPRRYPHELSGGQRQRLCIAIALACDPALLIADEPTSALDGATAAQVVALLQGLVKARGMALLFVTHDLDLASGLADRLALLDKGRLVENAPLPQALDGPHVAGLFARLHHVPRRQKPTGTSTPVLAVEGLAHAYGPHRVLDGIDLTLAAGEIVGLVGSSGEGKSTLLRLVLGLERPRAGRVLIDGQDLHRARNGALRRLRRRIQAVFQDPGASLDPRWRVGAIVAEPLGLLDPRPDPATRQAQVGAALARVGLPPDAANRLPSRFSGGQRQRIALARALVVDPDVIVLDEATSALDAAVRADMLDLIAELAAAGTAFLFVSHDEAMITALSDRVYRLREGRITPATPALSPARLYPSP